MKNKENNAYYIKVNKFFGEVKEYIEEFKKNFKEDTIDDAKSLKMKLFDIQK